MLRRSAHAEDAEAEFFEKKIRPVLATHCFSCHASTLADAKGDLVLDTKAGLARGGFLGPEIVPGKPDESRLMLALRHTDPGLAMPPAGKLPDAVIADFERWIARGAVDPRADAPSGRAPATTTSMPIDEGRRWWAFQPLIPHVAPRPRLARHAGWARDPIDGFVLAALEAKNLSPSPAADRRTLVTRAYVDVLGYKPTFDEVRAFVGDAAPNAYERLIDTLLASPHYGERWARHWMDVARFGEDNPTAEATNPAYPFAWRYRDWIIQALNADVPYDRFIALQLAADKMPGEKRDDLRALGYLGAAPVYHKDQRLSADVTYGFMTDDWDDRIDALTRGVLGLTVACARCHDHKFDPILTKDYYALAGVFASTMRAERPLFEVEPDVERRYLWVQRRLFDLAYSVKLATNETTTLVEPQKRMARWKGEIELLKVEVLQLEARYPQLVDNVRRFWNYPPPPGSGLPPLPPVPSVSEAPFMQAVYDAAQFVNGTDDSYTFIDYTPGIARALPILKGGNVGAPGEVVPRGYVTVLSNGDTRFQENGSGRLELAQRIFSDSGALAARVIVNRVWDWHFGRPLVGTPSDFGTQGEKPSHPELLDDLAARFVAHGWSLKWLHKAILLSATYRQHSRPRPEAEAVDPSNALYWRMNPRRLDAESYRDSLLRAAGRLDPTLFGKSGSLQDEQFARRTLYGRVSRADPSGYLRLYDFPDANQTNPGRDLTTTSLQQLFVMNGAFLQRQATALGEGLRPLETYAQKVGELYRRVLARDPSADEVAEARAYLKQGSIERLAQILLSTNEEIFVP
ncbi:MAG TPA: PSD1 and planctomycete cytochrome C domain-containing protein [Polyangiaceae bacterium]|nr:PSD1 and planctomycete cytochrome C domain-containing protein [Polyangiaceae bacterium]